MSPKATQEERTLTDADIHALALQLKKTGCLVFTEEERAKLHAFTAHTTVEGAETLGKVGVIVAGEQRFYGKMLFRAFGLILIGVLVWIFGNRICAAIFGKAAVELWVK